MKLRDYQIQAVDAFKNNHYIGIMNMATGTGKTFTSIAAVEEHYALKNRQFLVIIVPFIHLIPQWFENLQAANITVDCSIFGARDKWYSELYNLVWGYNHHIQNRVVVIGTYRSINTPLFKKILDKLNFQDSFLLADECHYFGAPNRRQNFFEKFSARLGLSATPARWWDPVGTSFIERLFDKEIFLYSMEQAIDNFYLTPYEYHPIISRFSDSEMKKFDKLSKQISREMMSSVDSSELSDQAKKLLIFRSKLVKQATEKKELLKRKLLTTNDHHYTLIYCTDKNEVNQILKLLRSLNISASRFDSDLTRSQRQKILQQFARGKVEILVAVKCLDEGVDIPATKTAYFLASTTNPREFIQRRGRILRQYPGKQNAVIYDFIVLPPADYYGEYAEKLVRHELPRVYELNDSAMNKYMAREKLSRPLRRLQLERYLDMSPQEIYEESQRESDGYGITKGNSSEN